MYHTCIIHVAIFSIHVTLCDFLFKSCFCIFLYHYCMAPHIGVTVYPTIYGHILHADLWHFYEKYHINCVPFVYYNCTAPHRCGSSVGYLWTHQTTGEERAGASPTDAKWRKWQSSYLVISHCILAYLIISHQWWIIISYQISSYVVICFPSPIITYHILVAYLCLLPNNKNDTHHIILPYLIICYAIFMKSDKVQVLFWYHILAVRSHWCQMIEMYQILSYIFICYHHLSLESLNLESPTKNMYIWELPVLISGRTRHRCAVHTLFITCPDIDFADTDPQTNQEATLRKINCLLRTVTCVWRDGLNQPNLLMYGIACKAHCDLWLARRWLQQAESSPVGVSAAPSAHPTDSNH